MRVVLLASGSGTLTQSVLDAFPAGHPAVTVAAVGSDRADAPVLDRARDAGVASFHVPPAAFSDRAAWDAALAAAVAEYSPDWVVSAGFMRILGSAFLDRFGGRTLNAHPALLPAFPGAHAVRDALAHGVKVTGTTLHLVDAGVDTGPVVGQFPVAVRDDDTEASLHDRIRAVERKRLPELLAHLAGHRLVVSGRRVSGWEPRHDTP
ncbi:phosphoribosylglycinamide formyltransferase [Brevibacterium litoralis]|uniref:phosphoribosylglycinamide formyltransferase n=1 Tax=Brevibacterium litoralis TaxID=3138935 RepID=UPI0032EBCA57